MLVLAAWISTIAVLGDAIAQQPDGALRPNSTKPNIIYIMLDDAGYGDFNNENVLVPNFARMCREGTRFTNHYCGSAVCAPTRCVLMTGLHSGHCRRRDNTATDNHQDFGENRPLVFLEPEDVTVAETLKSAGYTTGGIGKWGLGNPGTEGSPDKQGFDHFYGYLDQVHAHSYYPSWLWKNGERQELPGNANGKRTTYTHDLFEADTLNFIRSNKDGPFFLYLPYCLPHGKYEIPVDDPANEPYADKPWPQPVKNYAAMMTKADHTVGKILDLLSELDIDENTIVFYTSDNGPNRQFVKPLGSGKPFRGIKRQLLEGGIRADMAVRWPGKIPAGMTSDFAWSMVDVLPTVCELAGNQPPKDLDGVSVVLALKGKSQTPHEFIYWEIHHPFQQAVRMGNWKAIRYGTKEPLQLFDLAQDKREENNVAGEHAEVVKKIESYLLTARTESRYYKTVEKASKKKRKR